MELNPGCLRRLFLLTILPLSAPFLALASNEYQIDLTLDPVKGTIHGLEKVVYKNETEAPLNSLTLEAPGLPGNPPVAGNERWRIFALVDAKGNNLSLSWKEEMEAYTVTLSSPLGAGFKTSFTLEYERSITPSDTTPGYLNLPDRNADTWYLKFRAYRSGSFGSDDFKDLSVSLTPPTGWVVAATGAAPLKLQAPIPPGKMVLSAKGVRNFALALSNRFRAAKGMAGAIPLTVYSLEGEEGWGKQALAEAAEGVNYYSTFLGSFPVTQIAILPAAPGESGEVASTNVIYAPRSENADLLRDAISFGAARLIWGWTLGDPSDSTPFIANGVAAWCQQNYLAKRNGIDLHMQFLRSGTNDTYLIGVLRGYDTTLLRTRGERAKIDWDFDRIVARAKSAAVIHMLGNLVSEEKLLQALKGMLKTNRQQVVTDRDFQTAVEVATGAKMDGFFDQWLRSKNTLDYYLSHVRIAKTDPGYEVHADVWKTGTGAMPVEVVVEDQAGAKVRSIFPADRASGEMVIPIKAPLASILLDPRGILPLLSRVGTRGRLDLAEELLGEGKLLRAGEQIDMASSESPQEPRGLFLKGRILKERGDWAGALALWAKVTGLSVPPEDPARIWSQIWTARLYDLQGKRAEATALYNLVGTLPDSRGSRAVAKGGLEKPFEDAWPPLVP